MIYFVLKDRVDADAELQITKTGTGKPVTWFPRLVREVVMWTNCGT